MNDHGGTTVLTQGPGRILTFLYGVLASSATGRSVYQIIAIFDRAPLAFTLSGVAAVIYLAALVAILRQARLFAIVACSIEMVGVLVVGTVSYLAPDHFRDPTVWSHYGNGYGYFPLVLPFLALWWLRKAPSYEPGEPPPRS